MGGVPININVNNTGSGLDHHVLHNFVQFESKIKDKAYNLNMGAVNGKSTSRKTFARQ